MPTPTTPRLYIALDGLDVDPLPTLHVIRRILAEEGLCNSIGIKIPPTIVRRIGRDGLLNFVCQVVDAELLRRVPIFFDYKLGENPRDTRRTCGELADILTRRKMRGIVNVHTWTPGLAGLVKDLNHTPLAVYAQSVLSFQGITDEWYRYHFGQSRAEALRHHVSTVLGAECAGIVCSAAIALDAKAIMAMQGLAVIATGIRMDPSDGIHEDPITPDVAVRAGFSVVMGTEIMEARSGRVVEPRVALERVKNILALCRSG